MHGVFGEEQAADLVAQTLTRQRAGVVLEQHEPNTSAAHWAGLQGTFVPKKRPPSRGLSGRHRAVVVLGKSIRLGVHAGGQGFGLQTPPAMKMFGRLQRPRGRHDEAVARGVTARAGNRAGEVRARLAGEQGSAAKAARPPVGDDAGAAAAAGVNVRSTEAQARVACSSQLNGEHGLAIRN